jgi:uncharacterized membrane protein YkvA (DUF1232 family)
MRPITEAFYRWLRSGIRHPQYRWAIVFASCLYLFSPIDLSTDLIPIVGWIDDGIILTILSSELAGWAIESRKQRQMRAKSDIPDGDVIEVSAR